MKKEWILNEEQLRRRKNSRLNHMQTQNVASSGSSATKTSSAMSVTTSNHLGNRLPQFCKYATLKKGGGKRFLQRGIGHLNR
uniref:Uncharacterized protein n=1 Tax=Parascaris equorum TaxID=6256 RepID=A0A914S5H0_PAREQ